MAMKMNLAEQKVFTVPSCAFTICPWVSKRGSALLIVTFTVVVFATVFAIDASRPHDATNDSILCSEKVCTEISVGNPQGENCFNFSF